MKKIFTLIAAAMLAAGAYADTLINYPSSQTGITVEGTTTFDAVKIKTNTTSISGIKFANSYSKDNAYNGNGAKIAVEGGFKAGDKITIAGAYNNADPKEAAIDIFTLDGTTPTTLFTTQQFINGRLVNDDPVEETFVLENDVDVLYLGRKGNTGAFITTLKVVRGEETPEPEPEPAGNFLINYPTAQTGITIEGTTTFDAVKIKTNTTSISGIKFANGYTSEGAYTGNVAKMTVEGGFKAGDKITIAGAFNNSDNAKKSAIDIFTLDGTTPTVLFTTQQFINGRLVNDDPVEETFVLENDVEELYLGRNGNTGTFITTLKVERSGAAGVNSINAEATAAPAVKKYVENGQVVIEKAGKKFTVAGAQLK